MIKSVTLDLPTSLYLRSSQLSITSWRLDSIHVYFIFLYSYYLPGCKFLTSYYPSSVPLSVLRTRGNCDDRYDGTIRVGKNEQGLQGKRLISGMGVKRERERKSKTEKKQKRIDIVHKKFFKFCLYLITF